MENTVRMGTMMVNSPSEFAVECPGLRATELPSYRAPKQFTPLPLTSLLTPIFEAAVPPPACQLLTVFRPWRSSGTPSARFSKRQTQRRASSTLNPNHSLANQGEAALCCGGMGIRAYSVTRIWVPGYSDLVQRRFHTSPAMAKDSTS